MMRLPEWQPRALDLPPVMAPRIVGHHRAVSVPRDYLGPVPPLPAELAARVGDYREIHHRRRIARQRMGAMGGQPIPHMAGQRIPFSAASGAAGGVIYETFARQTSAAALTPTQQKEYLAGIWLEGAQKPGAWQFLFDGVHQAIFPVGASGFDATGAIGPEAVGFYPINYGPIGTNIPAAVQTYGGGLAAVCAVFSNKPNPLGYRISAFTGVFQGGDESGTAGTSRTYSIPGALGKPIAIVAHDSISVGTATGFPVAQVIFPAIGNYAAYYVPAILARGFEDHYPMYAVPDYDPAASFALTHKAITLAAATDINIEGTLYYRQGLQPVAKA